MKRRRPFKIIARLFTALLLLAVTGLFVLNLPATQQWLTPKVESWLAQKLQTRVEVGGIRVKFPESLTIKGLRVDTPGGDTLLQLGNLHVAVDMWDLFRQRLTIQEVTLEQAVVKIRQQDQRFNFDFITEAFSTPDAAPSPVPADTSGAFRVILQPTRLNLNDVKVNWENQDDQQFITANLGKGTIGVQEADFTALLFSIATFNLENSDVTVRMPGEAVDTASNPTIFDLQIQSTALVSTRFLFADNNILLKTALDAGKLENLVVKSDREGMAITNSRTSLENSTLIFRENDVVPTPGHFNPADLDWTALTTSVKHFSYQKDNLELLVDNLSGRDKSGVVIDALGGNMAYAPGSVTVQNLDFKGNNTKISGGISLELEPSPAPPLKYFLANLNQAEGTLADLLRFFPPGTDPGFLEKMKEKKWTARGKIEGSLQRFSTPGFTCTLGKNNHLRMVGSAANIDRPERLQANLRFSSFHFDKNDFTPFLLGKNWPLPAFLHATGNVAGTAGNLTVDLTGSLGTVDSLAYAEPSADTAFFNLNGRVKGLRDAQTLDMDLVVNQMDVPGRVLQNVVPGELVLPDNISLQGTFIGTLQQLSTEVEVAVRRSGLRSTLAGQGSLTNLTAPDSLGFDVAFSGELARAEIFGYLPDSLLTPFVRVPSIVAIEGSASGRSDDFVTETMIGLDSLGFLLLDGWLQKEKYAVHLQGKQLAVGQLVTDSTLQSLRMADFDFQVEGDGFDLGKQATASVAGRFNSLTWEEWTMTDLAVEAGLDGEKFTANISNPDPRLHLSLLAAGDLGLPVPTLTWDATVNCLDLRALGIAQEDVQASFQWGGRLDGFSPDTLDATTFLQNMLIQQDTLQVEPGDVHLTASFHNRKNDLTVSSDWLNAWLSGEFDLSGLSQLAADFSQHYFRTKKQRDPLPPAATADSLSFGLSIVQPDLFTTGIIPGLYELESFSLTGGFNSRDRRFELQTDFPLAHYESWKVKDLSIQANGDGRTANFFLDIPVVQQYGELVANNLSLSGTLDGETANARFTSLDSLGKTQYELAVFAETAELEDGLIVHFSPTQFIDYEKWDVPTDNEISYDGQKISVKNLHLVNGRQALLLGGSSTSLPNGQRALDFTLQLDSLNLSSLEVLMAGSLKDLVGTLDGRLKIGGTTATPKPSGSLALKDAKATVALSNVRYALSEKELVFQPSGLDLSGLTLTDQQAGSLTINGMLKTKNWIDLQYDLTVSSRKWLVLDTKQSQNAEYFGRLTAVVDGTIKGPLAQPVITLSVKPVKGSVFNYIYDSALDQSTGEGVVIFVRPVEIKRKTLSRQYPLQLNMNLEVDENLLLKVVADPASGDNFEGTLDGRLALEIYPDGTINLGGRCEVKSGTYRYFYQNIVKRNFEIAPGSYLAWSGDPFNPDLQITARYVVRTSPYPLLVQGGGGGVTDNPELRNYQTFFLNFKVTNDVERPELNIDVEYPDNQTVTQGGKVSNSENPTVQAAIASLNSDEERLPQQVFGLLVFNGFLGSGAGLGGANLGLGLNDFLSSQFNALASQYIKFVDVSLNVREDVVFSGDNESANLTNYNLSLQKSFLNDRLTFKISGGAEGDINGGSQWRSSFENAEIEYALTPNGMWKVRAFSEDGLELLNSDVIRNSGAGLVFTKEFKKLNGEKKEKK